MLDHSDISFTFETNFEIHQFTTKIHPVLEKEARREGEELKGEEF